MPRRTGFLQIYKAAMASLLFLDYDGVLHAPLAYPDGPYFTQLPLLESVLLLVPEVEVIISSSWRLQMPFAELIKPFSELLLPRIKGSTPDPYDVDPTPELRRHYRQAEIDAWLRQNRRRSASWVALDDHSEGFLPGCRQLVYCKPGRMFDEETAALLLRRLKKQN